PDDPLVAEESAAELLDDAGKATRQQVTGFVGPLLNNIGEEEVCRLIERGAAEGAERFWTLDPIDGTKGFLRGEQYAVALALIENGQVTLGALGCPNLNPRGEQDLHGAGAVFVAKRGAGAWAATLRPDDQQFGQLRVST